MATKNGDKWTDGCTFHWIIKNLSHSWLKLNEKIDSPRFIADALQGTKWFLRLYTSGLLSENSLCLYLRREDDCVGPDSIFVNIQLVFLGLEGSILGERILSNFSFINASSKRLCQYEDLKKSFVTEGETFLPEDTLTVQCTIWNTKEKPVKPQQIYAQTVFKVKRKHFMWRMEKFSTLKCGLRNKIKDRLIEFDLILSDGLGFEKKLTLNTNSFDESIKYFSFTCSIITAEGKKESCGTHEYSAEDLRGTVSCTLLSTQKLFENINRYLPNDIFSLDCEYAYSNGSISYEQCGGGIFSPKLTSEAVEKSIVHDIGKQDTLNTSVLNDLKSMYDDAIFIDTEIRTLTQTFSAHRAVLSARSPVFRSMFSHDMKEKNSGHVDVTDFEDDTVRRMLLYMYTDTLDDLQFESAHKLYRAADKYQIPSLKIRCCDFLKDCLSPTRACEVLILADQHQDSDLKCFVHNYILENYKDVLNAEEWKDFMDTHLKLAADVMYRCSQIKMKDT